MGVEGVWGELGLVVITVVSVTIEEGLFWVEGACCHRPADGRARMTKQTGDEPGWYTQTVPNNHDSSRSMIANVGREQGSLSPNAD